MTTVEQTCVGGKRVLMPSPIAFAGHLHKVTLGLQISLCLFFLLAASVLSCLHPPCLLSSRRISLELLFFSLSLTFHFMSHLVFSSSSSSCLPVVILSLCFCCCVFTLQHQDFSFVTGLGPFREEDGLSNVHVHQKTFCGRLSHKKSHKKTGF